MSWRRQRGRAQRRAGELTSPATAASWLRDDQGATRQGWRLLIFFVVAAAAIVAANVVAGMLTATAAAFGLRLIIHPLIFPAALLVAHGIVVNRFEHGDWGTVGLHGAAAHPRRWARPGAIAALAIGAPVLLLLAAGWLEIIAGYDGSVLAGLLRVGALVIPFAFAEELLARGYLFAKLRAIWGWPAALAITSIGFGLLHLPNPGVSGLAIANVMLAGVFLGLVLVRTASLYAAWAAHAAWNFTLAGIFHADVSGLTLGGTPKYRLVDSGPDWITGGAWGPEGGTGAALGLLAAIVIFARMRLPTTNSQRPATSLASTGEKASNA